MIQNNHELAEMWRAFPHTFAQKASRQRWTPYHYLRTISLKVTEGIVNENLRLVVSMPPRHGKSEFLSHWLPIWFLEMWPEKKIMLTSYSLDLAATFGRRVRNELMENEALTTKLAKDSFSAAKFATTAGGGMISAGVGGSITGKGAHLFLIDDPYKNDQEAYSESHRQKIESWYESTARTRLEPGGSIILIMTRWHENDLAAHLIKKHGFQEIVFPAIDKEGKALCPDRYNEIALELIKKDVGSFVWNSLYQQDPIAIEGGLFKRNWWQTYKHAPHGEIVQFWDCAQKAGISNDFSVCATWLKTGHGFYLLDIFKARLEYPQLIQAVKTNYAKFSPRSVYIEDKASGISIIQELRQKSTIPILAYDPGSRDKEVRALAATALCEAGKLYLPEGKDFVEDFLREHEKFPAVEHDDQVDTTSMMAEIFQQKQREFRIRAL